MSKVRLSKGTKINLVIGVIFCAVTLIMGGKYIMQKKAEEYILREAQVGLRIYFEKYYDDVDPNSIKLEIKQHKGMTTGPYIEGYVNDNRNLNFSCYVIRLPKDKWKTLQDELGMVITDPEPSEALGDMLKYRYSFDNPNRKGEEKRPSELIPKSEVEKAKKNRDLLDFIPDMRTF